MRGENEVLSDISLSVEEGQVVSVIGPSGSGKSTLLRCATLLETMDGGDLKYMGQYAVRDENGRAVYASAAELKKLRACFGLVFQNFNLFPHYSVLRNIAEAPMLIQKRPKDEVYETARELLRKMGLSDRENAYPYQLSGGQQLRVVIARRVENHQSRRQQQQERHGQSAVDSAQPASPSRVSARILRPVDGTEHHAFLLSSRPTISLKMRPRAS